MFARFDSLVRTFDDMLQKAIVESLESDGVQLNWRAHPCALHQRGDGLHLDTDDERSFGPFDSVIWAIGRYPLTEELNLEAAGIELDGYGFIPTDKFQATNVPHVFAIGDVTGRDALTPVAIAAGRRLAGARAWPCSNNVQMIECSCDIRSRTSARRLDACSRTASWRPA